MPRAADGPGAAQAAALLRLRGAQTQAVLQADPRLLVPTHGVVPAAELASDLAGEPGVVRVEGPEVAWSALDRLTGEDAGLVAAFLRRLAALSVAVAPRRHPVAGLCDLWTPDRSRAGAWQAAFERAPLAAMAATFLSRRREGDPWDALVAESATYSMLQAGPEFARWRSGRPKGAGAPPDAGSPRVSVAHAEGYTEVVLARPSRHNALDTEMRDELHRVLAPLARDRRAVVALTGEGPSFCSGGDLAEFGTYRDAPSSHAVRLSRSLAADFCQLGPRMVVGIHGACLGAGIELPAFAAAVVAAEDARIGLPELRLGLVPGAGGTVSIPRRAGRAHLLELLLAEDGVGARAALKWRLVDEVVPRDELGARVAGRARALARALGARADLPGGVALA